MKEVRTAVKLLLYISQDRRSCRSSKQAFCLKTCHKNSTHHCRADIQSPPRWRSTVSRSRSPLLLMCLVDERCVLQEPVDWLCLQLDCPPSVAELFRLPPLKSGTVYRHTSSQLPRYSPSGITWKRFYYNNLSAYSNLVDLVVISVT